MDKYAMYLRKSRQDEEAEKLGEGETLARHRKILTELASRKGLYIEKTYEEIVSGETIENRPEVKQLIQDCYDGKYKGIVVVEVTRLSRGNQGDAQIIMDCLKYSNNRQGVLVITPTKIYDVAHSSDDERFMEFELFMSRQEYNMIKRRLDRGRKQAVVEGQYMGSYRPYGYDILKCKTGRTLIPNENEAPVVKMIFDLMVNDNMTAGQIARKLTSMNIPTYSGEQGWSHATIKTIVTNPTYVGKVKWNDRMQVKKMVDGKLVKSRPRSNHTEHYMVYNGRHPALIDEETFKKASSKFHSDKTKANLKLKNPLASLLVCKKCGLVFGFKCYNNHPTRNDAFFHSYNKGNLCRMKSMKYTDVMNTLVNALKGYIDNFELHVNNLPLVDENTLKSQICALQKQIKTSENKMSKLFDSWEDGLIDNNDFVLRKNVHKQRIESLKKEIEELEHTIPEKEEFEEKIIMFSEAVEMLKDTRIDAEVKNSFLKTIIEKIEVSRDSNDEFTLDIYFK